MAISLLQLIYSFHMLHMLLTVLFLSRPIKQLGVGSAFHFFAPVQVELFPLSSPELCSLPSQKPRCSVLLCENGSYNEQLRLSLQLEYDCHLAVAGDYAQLHAMMLSQPFDVVLASCSMVDEMQHQELEQSFAKVPVIMLVNTNDIERIQTLLSGGVRYLHKPLHHGALMELVEQALSENKSETHHESKELAHMGTSGSINESNELDHTGPLNKPISESTDFSSDGLDTNQRFVSIAGDSVCSPTKIRPSSRPHRFSSPISHKALSSLLAGGHDVSALNPVANRGRSARRNSNKSNGFEFRSLFHSLPFILIRFAQYWSHLRASFLLFNFR